MTNDEAAELFGQLVTILDAQSYGWIVRQVGDHIRLGIEREEVVDEVSESPVPGTATLFGVEQPAPKKPRKSRVSVRRTIPYTDVQKLELLVGGMRRALVEANDVEQAVLSAMPGDSIAFLPEDGDGKFVVQRAFASERNVRATILARLISELESVSNAD